MCTSFGHVDVIRISRAHDSKNLNAGSKRNLLDEFLLDSYHNMDQLLLAYDFRSQIFTNRFQRKSP